MTKPLVAIAAAIGVSAFLVSPLLAAPTGFDERTVQVLEVRSGDLDLDTAEGQQMLRQRVEKAVRHVCRIVDSDTGLRVLDRDSRACMAKARASANRQMAALIGEVGRGG